MRPLLTRLAVLLACGSLAVAQTAPTQRFCNLNGTFHIDLPVGWRQLAPNEARGLGEMAGCPLDLRYVEPRSFYAVGPVEEWLRGDFSGPFLWVVEQTNEWVLDGDLKQGLQERWRVRGTANHETHEVISATATEIGPGKHPVVLAERRFQAKDGPLRHCLDLHAPSGGQQVSLAFSCAETAWPSSEASFRAALSTLAFARPPKESKTLSDHLFMPLCVGAAVGLVFLLLYRHNQRSVK